MKNSIKKRLIEVIPMILFISIVSFILMQLAPGDPIQSYITPTMSPEDVERVRHNLGLDQSVFIQYINWFKNAIRGNLGFSLINYQPVTEIILEKIPATLGLMGSALLLSLILAIPLGLIAAYYRNSIIDKVLNVMSYIGISIPSFWFAIILIYIFSVKLRLLPSVGMRTIGVSSTLDVIKHGILPCIVLSFSNLSVYMRYIRSSTISQLEEDYVVTQYAYGASTKKVLFKHVFKNTLLPVITILGMSLPQLISGAFITETVFGWPGMGQLGIKSIFSFDYPVIMGITIFSSLLLILGNLIADILYAKVDPRIKN